MIWLSGTVNADILAEPRIGVILTPMTRYAADVSRTVWAADNGCFSQPQAFTVPWYLDWLTQQAPYRAICLFATAPDVLGDARATWARSAPVLPLIRAAGYPAALVAQNGIETMRIEWGAFDALFIGGDTAWKLSESTYTLMREAKARGKWVHVGRVNSLRRLRAAESGGADSADGTFIKFAPDTNLARVRGWLARPGLWGAPNSLTR